MNTDETRDMLAHQMGRALQHVIDALDATEELSGLASRYGDEDDWESLSESVQDLLRDHGIAPDDEGDWDVEPALESVREALDPLSVTWEKGEPFDVALALGGPNIFLVDFGGHGGAQLVGHWGTKHVMTGPDVSRAVDHYREEFAEIYGE